MLIRAVGILCMPKGMAHVPFKLLQLIETRLLGLELRLLGPTFLWTFAKLWTTETCVF